MEKITYEEMEELGFTFGYQEYGGVCTNFGHNKESNISIAFDEEGHNSMGEDYKNMWLGKKGTKPNGDEYMVCQVKGSVKTKDELQLLVEELLTLVPRVVEK